MHLKPTIALATLLLAAGAAADDRADAMQALTESNFDKAVALYSQLVGADGSDGESRYRLGIALMSVDRLDDAVRQFEAASSLGYQSMGVCPQRPTRNRLRKNRAMPSSSWWPITSVAAALTAGVALAGA